MASLNRCQIIIVKTFLMLVQTKLLPFCLKVFLMSIDIHLTYHVFIELFCCVGNLVRSFTASTETDFKQ